MTFLSVRCSLCKQKLISKQAVFIVQLWQLVNANINQIVVVKRSLMFVQEIFVINIKLVMNKNTKNQPLLKKNEKNCLFRLKCVGNAHKNK